MNTNLTVAALAVAYVFMYIMLLYYILVRARRRFAFARAARGCRRILVDWPDHKVDRISQLQLLYEQLAKRYGRFFTDSMPSAVSMLNQLIFFLDTTAPNWSDASTHSPDVANDIATENPAPSDTRKPERLNIFYRLVSPGPSSDEMAKSLGDPLAIRPQLLDSTYALRELEPFAGLTGKRASLFHSLLETAQSGDFTAAETTIKHLADETLQLEIALANEEQRSKRNAIISWVGIILTLVFGGISTAQLVWSI